MPIGEPACLLLDARGDKAALLQYGQESRSPDERRAVREVVKYVEQDITQIEGLIKADSFWFGSLEMARKYVADLDRFRPNYLRDTGLHCPACGGRIQQVKKALPMGQRRFWRIWRCGCIFAAASLPLPKDSRVKEALLWEEGLKRVFTPA
jgi:hypothetical protein